MSESYYVPNGDSAGWVKFSRHPSASTNGQVVKKHLLSRMTLRHPVTKKPIDINDEVLQSLVSNFEKGVSPIVQVPLANEQNAHVDNPDRNTGEVVAVEYDKASGKLYGYLDIRKPDIAKEIGNTILGISAYINMSYEDPATGKNVGPVLKHTLLTNDPFITNLDDFEKLVKASNVAEGDIEILEELVNEEIADSLEEELANNSGEEPKIMTKDEMIAALKAEFGVDVEALTVSASEVDGLKTANADLESKAALSNVLAEALTEAGAVKLSNSNDLSTEDIIGAVAELAEGNVKLSNDNKVLTAAVEALQRKDAEAEVDALVDAGRLVPSQRDAMVEVRLSSVELFNKLVPADAIVKLSVERGTSAGQGEGEVTEAAKIKEAADAMIAALGHNSK